MRLPLKWVIYNPWLWIIIFSMSAILIGPFIVLRGILALPAQYRGFATFSIILSWGIVAGYKDWIKSKRQKKRLKIRR